MAESNGVSQPLLGEAEAQAPPRSQSASSAISQPPLPSEYKRRAAVSQGWTRWLMGILFLDAFVHACILFWFVSTTKKPFESMFELGLAVGVDDLLVLVAPVRVGLMVFFSLVLARRVRANVWTSRRKWRKASLLPKVAVFVVWSTSAFFGLVKALARVVERTTRDTDEDETPILGVFIASTVCTMIASVLDGWAVRNAFAAWYDEAQLARRAVRKARRADAKRKSAGSVLDSSLLQSTPSSFLRAAPRDLLRYDEDSEDDESETGAGDSHAPAPAATPSAAEDVGAKLSDHESDDDSSSDEEDDQGQSRSGRKILPDQIDQDEESQSADLSTYDALKESVRLRASERRRRVRERRRTTRKDKDQKMATGASVYELLKFSAPDGLYLFIAFVCLVVAAVAGAFVPKFTGQVINNVSGAHPDRDAFKTSVLMLTASAIVSGVFAGLRGAFFTVSMARLNVRLRRALFKSLLNQDQAFFDSTKIGELTSRLSSSTTTVSDQISLNINVFLRSIVEGSIVLVLMFRLSWRLSLLSFAAIPLMTIISAVYGEFYRKLSDTTNDALADTSAVAEEALSSIATVRDFGARRAERRAFAEELRWFYSLNTKAALAYSGYAFTWTAIPALVTALTLWEGGKLVLDAEKPAQGGPQQCGTGGVLCGGDLVSFMLYSQSLSGAIDSVGAVFQGLSGALGAADKIFDLLRRKPRISAVGDEDWTSGTTHASTRGVDEDDYDDGEAKLRLAELAEARASFVGTVEMDKVAFRYPSRPGVQVLKDFSFKVEKGQVVALCGFSGGGKSSVIKLLLHHYEPEAGRVLVSGKPVASYPQRVLRRMVSVVGQEPIMFGRSVLRNIVYGLEGEPDEPSFQDVVRAAKLANAHDFIQKLPKGYATLLGERGSTISGGQKQRCAIARALVREPRILLLDESTSALDAESEAKVLQALDNIVKQGNVSVLVVAHRLSTIKNADRILVVDGGVVAEQGKHDELIKQGGKYAELVRKQLANTALGEPVGL